MSLTGRVRRLLSPEGPFASPFQRRARSSVTRLANVLCVDLYEWSASQRAQAARYIALHRDECLFLYFRVYAEFDVRCSDSSLLDALARHTFGRLYGQGAPRLIADAAGAFAQQDPQASVLAKHRCLALAAASAGDTTRLRDLNEFDQGLRRGRELFSHSHADQSPQDDDVLAYLGLHALWLSDRLNSQSFGEWLALQHTQAALDSVVERFMRRASKANRSSQGR